MVDILQPLTKEVKLAHPFKTRLIAEARIKTDHIDAESLAHLLRADLIPEAYLRNQESRREQRILRSRCFYVRLRTKLKNRIHHLIDGQPEEIREQIPKVSDLFGKAGRQWLESLQLQQPDQGMLQELLGLHDQLSMLVASSDKLIAKLFKQNEPAQRIKTLPGFGEFLSVLVAVEIADIHRFRSGKHLSSYAGIVPSTYSSGGITRHGKITKLGSKWLRWALVEAAMHAPLSSKSLKSYSGRIRRRKGTKAARLAVARKLCHIIYRVLTQDRNYYEDLQMRSRPQAANSAAK
jgi:transposase